MFIIGIDPHKGSHTAAVIDGDEQVVGALSVRADRRQRDRLLGWAAAFEPRVWAVEGATGVGALSAQQLVGAGETVVDVPAALSARVRLLDAGRKDKTDTHDARSAAIVALRHRALHAVALEDHRQVLRLLARRHHQLVAGRTRAICRLHTVLCEMIAGGLSKNLSAKRAASELRKFRPTNAIAVERKHVAVEFLDEVRRHDQAFIELHRRINDAVNASCTSVTDVFGAGPIVACYLIGYSGDIRRFPTAGHYGPLQRDRTHRSIIRTEDPSSTQPQRQPSTQPRNPHRRARPDQPRPRPAARTASPNNAREVTQRSDALPQTTAQRRRLPTTAR